MVSKKITLTNEQGLHMRPASVFSQAMTPFACDVTILFKVLQRQECYALNECLYEAWL